MTNRYRSGQMFYKYDDTDDDDDDDVDFEEIVKGNSPKNGAADFNISDDDDDTCLREYCSSQTEISDALSCVSLEDDALTESEISTVQNDPTLNDKPKSSSSLLTPSLFPNVPPTIHFSLPTETVEAFPDEGIYKVLKWHLTSTMPLILKRILANMGFKFSRNSKNWIGMWGKHRKAFQFRFVKAFQKVNHFPGTFQIGRKDRLWRNMFRMQFLHGRKDFGFVPLTFVLPNDLMSLRQAWEMGGATQYWIVKPPASSRGNGIKVVHKFAQIPKRGHVIVQRYLSTPYLINGAKFDLRLYVYVASYNPLRVYLHDEGLTRFASVKYSNASRSLSDRYMHLTNYCVNKRSLSYLVNEEVNACKGHKWSLNALWGYLETKNVDVADVKRRIDDVVVKTVMSIESSVNILTRNNVSSRYSCHELFGFDIMLDENLKLWLLEVNISPSLHSSSSLDIYIKGQMLKDLLNLAGFHIPGHADERALSAVASYLGTTSTANLVGNESFYCTALDAEEKRKHSYYQRCDREKYLETILEHLTPDDVRALVEAEDEFSRRGGFRRIFPSPSSHGYGKYFDTMTNRYYSYLFDAWEHHYGQKRDEGRAMLGELCARNYHLEGLAEKLSPKLNVAAWQCVTRHKVSKISARNRYRRYRKFYTRTKRSPKALVRVRRNDIDSSQPKSK